MISFKLNHVLRLTRFARSPSLPVSVRDGWLSAVLLCLFLVFPAPLFGQDTTPGISPVLTPVEGADIRLPADLSQLDFYLVTVDVGDMVWDNFGHTALRMVDRNTDTDLVFNWGLFDASIGYVRFASNFMQGIMDYRLGISPPGWEFGRYQQEQRTVWQDRLVLTDPQKRRLYERLAWNIRDENIEYQYDYFFDNCTTRVRDYLDEALGGALSQQNSALTQRTYRDEVRSHYASLPLISFSLDVLMNERIDRRMTQWERMFLPMQLRERLQAMGLLEDSQTVMEFDAPSAGLNPYYLAASTMLPLLLLLLCLQRASIASFSSQPGFGLRVPALTYRLLGLVGLVITLFSGIYGLIMTLGWLFSAHQDLHANMNLLLFWPTDLIGVLIALRWLLTGGPWTISEGRHQLVVSYLVIHVMAAVVYLVMAVAGLTDQALGALTLYVLPALMLFTLLVALAGVRRTRSIRFT